MRFLIFVFNAYSIISVTSLVEEPEKLRLKTYDFLNRYHLKLSPLRAFCSKAQFSRVSRILFFTNFRKGRTKSNMFRHKYLLVFGIFRFIMYTRSTERMRRLICAFVVRIFL